VTTPDPLSPELDELLRAARPLDGPPDDARERLARRVALSVAAPIVVGAGVAAAVGASSAGATAVRGALSPLAQKVLIGVTSLLLGGGIGAATHAALAPAPVVVVVAAPPVAAPAPAPSGSPAPTAPPVADIPTVSFSDLPAAASAPAATPRPAASSTGLADERRLLDGARAALSRGEAAAALPPLAEHARRFPHGILTEEREALAIQALARSGRAQEAEERAARFEKAFPGSFMMPAVKDALGAPRDRP
jgi:hypothetical protein